MRRLFHAALAPSTGRAYRKTLSELALFLGLPSFHLIISPLETSDIIRYIAFLFNGGLSYPSILSRLSAVSFWIRLKDWPLVTRSHLVLQALKGVRALSLKTPVLKFPITPSILQRLCDALASSSLSHFDQTCFRAMFLLAFHAFLRVGEICGSRHALHLSDITITSVSISISFRSFKFSHGRYPCVFIPASASPLSPVEAMRLYLSLRGLRPGPLFLDSKGHPLSTLQFRSGLSHLVRLAGLSSLSITPHSFRVGAATSAAALGISEDVIQRMGRWSSRAFMRYIRYQINRF